MDLGLTHDDFLEWTWDQLLAGNTEVMELFQLHAQKEPFITIQTYRNTATMLYIFYEKMKLEDGDQIN